MRYDITIGHSTMRCFDTIWYDITIERDIIRYDVAIGRDAIWCDIAIRRDIICYDITIKCDTMRYDSISYDTMMYQDDVIEKMG